MAKVESTTQLDNMADKSGVVEDIDIDDYLREAERTFKRSNTEIERAAARAFDYRELRIVVNLAKISTTLVEQMGDELPKMNDKQQSMYHGIQTETQGLYERLQNRLKPEGHEFNRAEAWD